MTPRIFQIKILKLIEYNINFSASLLQNLLLKKGIFLMEKFVFFLKQYF